MKNKFLIALCASFCVLCSGCRVPTKRKNLTGLYKLTYDFTDYDKQPDVDWIADRGSESYYIVGENDIGYYVWKTTDGNYLTKEIKMEFPLNEDGKIGEFNYTDGKGNYTHMYIISSNSEPGFEYKHVSLFVSKTTVRYTKISDNCTIEYLEKLLNVDLTYVTYDQFKYEGAFVSENWNQEESENIYEFFYLHTGTLVADFYTKRKEDGVQQITSYPVSETPNSFVINGVEYQKMINEYNSYYLQSGDEVFYNCGEYIKSVTDQFESDYQNFLSTSE